MPLGFLCGCTLSGSVGGNVLDLVALMERCSLRDVPYAYETGSAPYRRTLNSAHRVDRPIDAPTNRPLGFALHNIDQRHAYLQNREIHPETATSFGDRRGSGGTGLLHGRIVVPIHNERGHLVAYVGRAVDNQQPKYRFPAGFRKSEVLFNLHRAKQTDHRQRHKDDRAFSNTSKSTRRAIRLSSPFGIVGEPSNRQADLLTEHFDRAIVMLDGDPGGHTGTEAMRERLEPRMPLTIVRLQDRSSAGPIGRRTNQINRWEPYS